MSKALFICDVIIDFKEGIYKKVNEQARVMSDILGECVLFSKGKTSYTQVKFFNGIECNEEKIDDFYQCILRELKDASVVYIRHMLPTFKQLRLLSLVKKTGCKLLYEIPTYPYFGEQIKNSTHKIRTFLRICVDAFAWPYIYCKVDKLIAIRSSTSVRVFKKMQLISNGIAKKNIKSFQIKNHVEGIHFVVVGTLYPYHGIDRLINAFSVYYENHSQQDEIVLHLVGSSPEIDNLHYQVKARNIPNIVFHGRMSTEELMEFYKRMDIGVGCLALFRRNADIDTTLKVVEYLCYGLPIVTSGGFPIVREEFERIRIKVSNDNLPISLEEILYQFRTIRVEDREAECQLALKELTWNGIIRKVLL